MGEGPTQARRRGPQARGQATRERLLKAAEQLFTRHGYDGTSMSDVASAAGVGVGTLYHHFDHKHTMLLEMVDRWGDRAAAQRRSELDFETFLGADPRRAIHDWMHKTYERLRHKPSLYLLVLAMADRDLEVRRRYQRVQQLAIERLTSLIEFGQRRGMMRADVHPRAAAFLVHHGIDMAVTQLLVRDATDLEPSRVLEEFADMICRYILEQRR